jgi:hypothetical protein
MMFYQGRTNQFFCLINLSKVYTCFNCMSYQAQILRSNMFCHMYKLGSKCHGMVWPIRPGAPSCPQPTNYIAIRIVSSRVLYKAFLTVFGSTFSWQFSLCIGFAVRRESSVGLVLNRVNLGLATKIVNTETPLWFWREAFSAVLKYLTRWACRLYSFHRWVFLVM